MTRAGFLALFAANLATLATFLIPGIDATVASNFPDDALFYNLIARSILAGLGSTSDGIAQSNGYHPLWAAVVVVVEALPGRSLVWEVFVLLLLNTASSYLLYRWLLTTADRWTALSVALFATFERSVFRVTWCGMETGLTWLMLLATLALLIRHPLAHLSRQTRFLVSLFLAMLFLSRLDGGLFWVALALSYLAHGPWETRALYGRSRALFAIFLPAACVAAAYLLANLWWFDSAMPISGRIKAIPTPLLFRDASYWTGVWIRFERILSVDVVERLRPLTQALGIASFPVSLVVFALLALAGRTALRRTSGTIAFRALAVYVALHCTYYSLLQSDPYSLNWARGPELLLWFTFLAGALSALFQRMRSARLRLVGMLFAVSAVVGMGIATQIRALTPDVRINDFSVARADFADAVQFIRVEVPPDEPIISWNIGFLGYYTERRVVSYDGLLNSPRYFKEYRSVSKVPLYMRQEHITYIANRIPRTGDPAQLLAAQFPGVSSSELEVLGVFASGAQLAGVVHRYAVARYAPLPSAVWRP